MTNDVIERYDTFNAKGGPYELIFGDFNDQPIPPNYYDFLSNYNDDGNNIPGNLIEYVIPEKSIRRCSHSKL